MTACSLTGYVTVFTALKFMANDGVHFNAAPRDRQHNRRDAIANVVIDWQAPLVGFSSPSDFNPITWSPGTVCCLARSEVRA